MSRAIGTYRLPSYTRTSTRRAIPADVGAVGQRLGNVLRGKALEEPTKETRQRGLPVETARLIHASRDRRPTQTAVAQIVTRSRGRVPLRDRFGTHRGDRIDEVPSCATSSGGGTGAFERDLGDGSSRLVEICNVYARANGRATRSCEPSMGEGDTRSIPDLPGHPVGAARED